MKMRILRLTPSNLDDPIRKKWSLESIIVRAESESERRHLAVLRTVKTFDAIPGAPIPVNPWDGRKKIEDPGPRPTLCEDITGLTSEFSVDGAAEVLRHGERF